MRAFLQNSELVTANELTRTGLIVANEEIPLSFVELAVAEEVGALLRSQLSRTSVLAKVPSQDLTFLCLTLLPLSITP